MVTEPGDARPHCDLACRSAQRRGGLAVYGASSFEDTGRGGHRPHRGRRRTVPGVVAFLVSLLAVGCSSAATLDRVPAATGPRAQTSTAQRTSLPPRPTVLPLDGVEPCALLAGPGARQLEVGPGSPHGSTRTGDAAQCQWSTLPARPDDDWVARVLLYQGANTKFINPSDTPLASVDGFSAVQITPPSNQARECVLYVDVAPHQSLLVEYSNDAPAGPGTTHAGACQKAQTAATFMVQRLRTLGHESR